MVIYDEAGNQINLNDTVIAFLPLGTPRPICEILDIKEVVESIGAEPYIEVGIRVRLTIKNGVVPGVFKMAKPEETKKETLFHA